MLSSLLTMKFFIWNFLKENKKTGITVLLIIFIVFFSITLHRETFEDGWKLTHSSKVNNIHGGLSGLTWNPERKTLFAVTDHPSSIIELSQDGKVIRVISSDVDHDFESIEWIGNDRYIISHEREKKLVTYHIDGKTSRLPLPENVILFNINNKKKNSGLEGITTGEHKGQLFLAQEKKPRRLYNLCINENSIILSDDLAKRFVVPWFLRDISGLHYNKKTQQLYILSHESALVAISDSFGKTKILSLHKGSNGLKDTIPQAEGIVTDDGNNLWIVSEPDLFYHFKT